MAATATSTSGPGGWASPICAAACRRCWTTAGASPQLATHLDTTQPATRRAITDSHIPQPPRRQLLTRQRQRAAQQRAAARAAELGFPRVRAYLVDRLAAQAWTLAQVAAELGAAHSTLRRLLEEHQVRRVAPTRRQRAAATAARGTTTQPRVVEQWRQARLAELGFAKVDDYLRDRYVGLVGAAAGRRARRWS
jgi:AraC-like DNA-binding protein